MRSSATMLEVAALFVGFGLLFCPACSSDTGESSSADASPADTAPGGGDCCPAGEPREGESCAGACSGCSYDTPACPESIPIYDCVDGAWKQVGHGDQLRCPDVEVGTDTTTASDGGTDATDTAGSDTAETMDADTTDDTSDTSTPDASDANALDGDDGTCGAGETYVDDACLSCGPAGGCAERAGRCVSTCEVDEDCRDDDRSIPMTCQKGVCRGACF